MEILHGFNKLSEWLFLCQRYVLPLYLVSDVCWFLAASTVVDLNCVDLRWANNQTESLRMKNDNSCGISGHELQYIIRRPPDIRSPYRDSLTTLPVEVRVGWGHPCFVKKDAEVKVHFATRIEAQRVNIPVERFSVYSKTGPPVEKHTLPSTIISPLPHKEHHLQKLPDRCYC